MEQQPSIKSLQQELEALQPNPRTISASEIKPDIMDIADDDPELRGYRVKPDGDVDPLFASIAAHDLAGAKQMVAKARNERAFLAAVQDESKPMDERVIAAHKWRDGRPQAKEYWNAFGDAELVERLSLHPHTARLQELSEYVIDSTAVPATANWQPYMRNQWAAIKEFRKLRDAYPLRHAPIVIGLEAVASKIINNSPAEVKESHSSKMKIYGYAKELEAGRHNLEDGGQEQADATNQANKTCCECYFVQPVINAVCSLCGEVPVTWLPAKEYPANLELDNLREMAASATIEQLQNASRSGWCDRPERERVIKNLLSARIWRRDDGHKRLVTPQPEPLHGDISSQVKSSIRLCEIREAEIARELAELRAKSGQSDNAEAPSVPWHQEPGYVQEKLRREALATGNALVPA